MLYRVFNGFPCVLITVNLMLKTNGESDGVGGAAHEENPK